MNKGFFKVFILKTLVYQREQLFFYERVRCSSAGSCWRTCCKCAGSSVANTSPAPACVRCPKTSPQALMAMLWPQVRRPFSCCPPCAAARTKHWFSMARARSSTSQCAWPVVRVKALGTTMMSAPAWAWWRYSSGKRRS